MKKFLVALVFGALLLSGKTSYAGPAELQGYKVVDHGSADVTTAGTPVQVSSTSTQCKQVIITGKEDNTDIIVVGGSNSVDATEASRTGLVVFPGQSFVLYVKDLDQLWLDAEVSGEGITYTYFK